MARERERGDSRVNAARYRVERLDAEWAASGEGGAASQGGHGQGGTASQGGTGQGGHDGHDEGSTAGRGGRGQGGSDHGEGGRGVATGGRGLDARGRDGDRPTGGAQDAAEADAGQPTMEQRAQYVEIAIQQAMRRGDFDDLPGAGKPLQGLGGTYDPDWWIRRKIERERLTGLGPPALTLRTEDAELEARLDALHSEEEVRRTLTDFNRRVVEARRQLQGGPPVVTRTRDVDAEASAWRERRESRATAVREARDREAAALAALPWRERRRARRARSSGTDPRP